MAAAICRLKPSIRQRLLAAAGLALPLGGLPRQTEIALIGGQEPAHDHRIAHQEDRLDDQNHSMEQDAQQAAALIEYRLRQRVLQCEVMQRRQPRPHRDGPPVAETGEQRQHCEVVHVAVGLPGMARQAVDHDRDLAHQNDRDDQLRHDGDAEGPERQQRGTCERESGHGRHTGLRIEDGAGEREQRAVKDRDPEQRAGGVVADGV
jgi:hypothetical protein